METHTHKKHTRTNKCMNIMCTNHLTQCWALSVMSMHTLPGDLYACMIAGRCACKTLLGMHSPCELNLSLDTAHMQCMVHKCHAHLTTRAAILWATDCMFCSNGACTPFAVSETCTLNCTSCTSARCKCYIAQPAPTVKTAVPC